MAGNTAERVEKLISATVAEMGYDLWDVRFLKEGASWYLRVFIDKDEGVWINDCTDVSHAIDPILDEADIIDKSYYLEVCSPGIERELRTEEHILACLGLDVEAKLFAAKDGRKSFVGVLSAFEDGRVVIEENEGEVILERSEISKLSTIYKED